MDTRIFYIAAIAIAVGGLFWQMGGFADLFAAESPGDHLETGEHLRDQANESVVTGNFSGDTRTDSSGGLVGMALSGGSAILDMIGMAVNAPYELAELGLPGWAAKPVGALATLFLSIGFIQFITNRVFR